MVKINQKNVLFSMLEKMYWMESEMEQLSIWSARIELLAESENTIKQLSNDSDRHRLVLEKWFSKLNLELPTNTPRGFPVKIFDFSSMAPQEMFTEIMKYEVLAKDVYSDIKDMDSKLIQEILPDEDDLNAFISDFETLIADESMHAKLCNRMIGGFDTIRAVHR